MTNDTERPWAAPGLSIEDRIRSLRVYGFTQGHVREAIAAAVHDALADAAPEPLGDSMRTGRLLDDLKANPENAYMVARKALVDHAKYCVEVALADATPKWNYDTLPPADLAKDYDRVKRYSADCWVYDGAEVQEAVYSYKTSKWMDANGDRINGVLCWQYVTVPEPPQAAGEEA